MVLSLTTSLSSTISKTELQDNFTSIQTKFNGGIDNSDIKASAGIVASKLAAANEYCVVTLETRGESGGIAATGIRDEVPFPGLEGEQNFWSLKAASWVCTDVGTASTARFDVEWGEYAADGSYSVVETLINAETLTFPSGGGTANSKQCTVNEAAVEFDASLSRVFRLTIDTVHTDALSTDDDPSAPVYLKVSLLLERQIQA